MFLGRRAQADGAGVGLDDVVFHLAHHPGPRLLHVGAAARERSRATTT